LATFARPWPAATAKRLRIARELLAAVKALRLRRIGDHGIGPAALAGVSGYQLTRRGAVLISGNV
jgi:hypothetical protein